MTHCAEYWKLWKKEPNFCGLSSSEVAKHDKYIRFVEKFSHDYGIEENIVYYNAPVGAVAPLLRFDPKNDIRKRTEKQIADTLNDKKAVTSAIVKQFIGYIPSSKKPKKPMSVTSEQATARHTLTLSDKIKTLTSILTSGQKQILLDLMELHGYDDEYAAMCHLFALAKKEIDSKEIIIDKVV